MVDLLYSLTLARATHLSVDDPNGSLFEVGIATMNARTFPPSVKEAVSHASLLEKNGPSVDDSSCSRTRSVASGV